jgi:hypothetical protein
MRDKAPSGGNPKPGPQGLDSLLLEESVILHHRISLKIKDLTIQCDSVKICGGLVLAKKPLYTTGRFSV